MYANDATMSRGAGAPLVSADAVHDAIRRWQREGDDLARAAVVQRFLPLARRLASRYPNPYGSREDLSQVAALGLLHAIDRFDPDRGARFESFAVPTILGEVKRFFRDTGWTAHVPRRAKELALTVDRGAREFSAHHGRAPRVDELAATLQLSTEDVLTGLDAGTAHFSASLDAPAPGTEPDEPQALVDHLGTVDDRLDLIDAKLSIADAVARLPYAERTALRLRLDDDLLQSEIALRMGCSQMQVSRLLRRAAERIRALLDPDLASIAG